MALVCLGWERLPSGPMLRAFSTNHHHEPGASRAMWVRAGKRRKTPSTVPRSLGKRSCQGALSFLNTASWDTLLCKSTPAKFSMGGLLLFFGCDVYHDATAKETIPFMGSPAQPAIKSVPASKSTGALPMNFRVVFILLPPFSLI